MPLTSIINNRPIGQPHSSVKRVKGLAVIGTGLTDKYFGSQRVHVTLTDVFVGTSA
jgi:hypothetical protein